MYSRSISRRRTLSRRESSLGRAPGRSTARTVLYRRGGSRERWGEGGARHAVKIMVHARCAVAGRIRALPFPSCPGHSTQGGTNVLPSHRSYSGSILPPGGTELFQKPGSQTGRNSAPVHMRRSVSQMPAPVRHGGTSPGLVGAFMMMAYVIAQFINPQGHGTNNKRRRNYTHHPSPGVTGPRRMATP